MKKLHQTRSITLESIFSIILSIYNKIYFIVEVQYHINISKNIIDAYLLKYQEIQGITVINNQINEFQLKEFQLQLEWDVHFQILSHKCSLQIALDKDDLFIYENTLTIGNQQFEVTTIAGTMLKLNLDQQLFNICIKLNGTYQPILQLRSKSATVKATGQFAIIQLHNTFGTQDKLNLYDVYQGSSLGEKFMYSTFLILKSMLLESFLDCPTIDQFHKQLSRILQYLQSLSHDDLLYTCDYILTQLTQLDSELCFLLFRLYAELVSHNFNLLTENGMYFFTQLISLSIKFINNCISQQESGYGVAIVYEGAMLYSGKYSLFIVIQNIIANLLNKYQQTEGEFTLQHLIKQTISSLYDILYSLYYDNIIVQQQYYEFIINQDKYKPPKNFYQLIWLRTEFEFRRQNFDGQIQKQSDHLYKNIIANIHTNIIQNETIICTPQQMDKLLSENQHYTIYKLSSYHHIIETLLNTIHFNKIQNQISVINTKKINNKALFQTQAQEYMNMLFQDIYDEFTCRLAIKRMKYDNFALIYLLRHFNNLNKYQQGVVLWESFIQQVFFEIKQINSDLADLQILNNPQGIKFPCQSLKQVYRNQNDKYQAKILSMYQKSWQQIDIMVQNSTKYFLQMDPIGKQTFHDDNTIDTVSKQGSYIYQSIYLNKYQILKQYESYLHFLCQLYCYKTSSFKLKYSMFSSNKYPRQRYNSRQQSQINLQNLYQNQLVNFQKNGQLLSFVLFLFLLQRQRQIQVIQKHFNCQNNDNIQNKLNGVIDMTLEHQQLKEKPYKTTNNQIFTLQDIISTNSPLKVAQETVTQDQFDQEICQICLTTPLTYNTAVHLHCTHSLCFNCLKHVTLVCPFCKAQICGFFHQKYEFQQDPELIEQEEDEEEYS